MGHLTAEHVWAGCKYQLAAVIFLPSVSLQDLSQPGCAHVFHKLEEFVKGHAPTICWNPKVELHGTSQQQMHGKSTSDVVKVGQSATLLVGELSFVVQVVRVNPIFVRTFCSLGLLFHIALLVCSLLNSICA